MLGYLVFVWEQKRYETKIGCDIRKRKIFGILERVDYLSWDSQKLEKEEESKVAEGCKICLCHEIMTEKSLDQLPIQHIYNIYTHTHACIHSHFLKWVLWSQSFA